MLLLLPLVSKTSKQTMFTNVINIPLTPPIPPVDTEKLFHRKSSEYFSQTLGSCLIERT